MLLGWYLSGLRDRAAEPALGGLLTDPDEQVRKIRRSRPRKAEQAVADRRFRTDQSRDSALQSQLDEVLGRAFGLVLPACMLAAIAGTAAAQVLADALSLPGALALLGALVLVYVPVATLRRPAGLPPGVPADSAAPAGEHG